MAGGAGQGGAGGAPNSGGQGNGFQSALQNYRQGAAGMPSQVPGANLFGAAGRPNPFNMPQQAPPPAQAAPPPAQAPIQAPIQTPVQAPAPVPMSAAVMPPNYTPQGAPTPAPTSEPLAIMPREVPPPVSDVFTKQAPVQAAPPLAPAPAPAQAPPAPAPVYSSAPAQAPPAPAQAPPAPVHDTSRSEVPRFNPFDNPNAGHQGPVDWAALAQQMPPEMAAKLAAMGQGGGWGQMLGGGGQGQPLPPQNPKFAQNPGMTPRVSDFSPQLRESQERGQRDRVQVAGNPNSTPVQKGIGSMLGRQNGEGFKPTETPREPRKAMGQPARKGRNGELMN